MNFILRIIAFSLTYVICKDAFPTFVGGFWTALGLAFLMSLTSPKKEEVK